MGCDSRRGVSTRLVISTQLGFGRAEVAATVASLIGGPGP